MEREPGSTDDELMDNIVRLLRSGAYTMKELRELLNRDLWPIYRQFAKIKNSGIDIRYDEETERCYISPRAEKQLPKQPVERRLERSR